MKFLTDWQHYSDLSTYYGDGFRYEVSKYIGKPAGEWVTIGWYVRYYNPKSDIDGFISKKLRVTRFTYAACSSSREDAQALCERHLKLMVLQ